MCIKVFYIFEDGPCETCVSKGHTADTVEEVLMELSFSLQADPKYEEWYWKYYDTLIEKAGFTTCSAAQEVCTEPQEPGTLKNDKKSYRVADVGIGMHEEMLICASTEGVKSFADQFKYQRAHPNRRTPIAAPLKIGNELPCPWALQGHYKWHSEKDRKAWNSDPEKAWKARVAATRKRLRSKYIGTDYFMDAAEWDCMSDSAKEKST